MDNFHNTCPPKMNDARCLTDYRSAKVREAITKKGNNIEDDNEFRFFLQSNGEKIINQSWSELKTQSCSANVCLYDCETRSTNEKMEGKLKQYTNGEKPACAVMKDLQISE